MHSEMANFTQRTELAKLELPSGTVLEVELVQELEGKVSREAEGEVRREAEGEVRGGGEVRGRQRER